MCVRNRGKRERKREQTGVMDLRSNVLQQVRERGPPVAMEMTKPDQYSRLRPLNCDPSPKFQSLPPISLFILPYHHTSIWSNNFCYLTIIRYFPPLLTACIGMQIIQQRHYSTHKILAVLTGWWYRFFLASNKHITKLFTSTRHFWVLMVPTDLVNISTYYEPQKDITIYENLMQTAVGPVIHKLWWRRPTILKKRMVKLNIWQQEVIKVNISSNKTLSYNI